VGRDPQNTGFWFSLLGLREGLFVPITQADSSLNSLPVLALNPLADLQTNSSRRYLELKKQASLLFQLVKWVYLVACREEKTLLEPHSFVTQYGEVNSRQEADPNHIYDLSSLPRFLPGVENVDKALSYLSLVVPSFVGAGNQESTSQGKLKFLFYNWKFQNNLEASLRVFRRRLEGPHKEIIVPSYLEDYYVFAEDFRPQPGVQVFRLLNDFLQWKANKVFDYRTTYRIYSALDKSLAQRKNPYLYLDREQGSLYLIQNVEGGSIFRVQALCRHWAQNQINSGYLTPPIPQEEFSPYSLFIVEDGVLKITESYGTSDNEAGFLILDYGHLDQLHLREQYAGILRLR
jgi:hypothetical protein